MHVYINVFFQIHFCIYTQTHIYISLDKNTSVCLHIYTNTFLHIYIYIHICVCRCLSRDTYDGKNIMPAVLELFIRARVIDGNNGNHWSSCHVTAFFVPPGDMMLKDGSWFVDGPGFGP